MSRAGEKLYGEWEKWNDAYEREQPSLWWQLASDLMLLGAVLAIAAALIG